MHNQNRFNPETALAGHEPTVAAVSGSPSGRTEACASTHRADGGRPEGAPPSNTAPANSIEDGFGLLLRFGIDSLYVSYSGALSQEKATEFDRLKTLAQSESVMTQALAVYSFGGHNFIVRDRGTKRCSYILDDPCYRLQIAGSKSRSLPLAYVKISSHWLTAKGVDYVLADLMQVVESFGLVEGYARVSRADLFVDFVSPVAISSWDRNAWVTRARDITEYSVDRQFSGWTLGRGAISCRLYDKTLEIKVSDKTYLKDLWYEAGWEHGQPVHRLEFQFRREVLRQLGVSTTDDLLRALSSLWSYATRDWLKLTLPNPNDQTQSRWPLHPLWEVLQAVPWQGPGVAVPIRFVTHQAPSDAYFASHHHSLLTGYMASKDIDCPVEGLKGLDALTRAYYNDPFNPNFICHDFRSLTREKVAAKRRLYCLPDPVSQMERDRLVRQDLGRAYRLGKDGE